jgi:oligopeptide transport system substrate-binding protein
MMKNARLWVRGILIAILAFSFSIGGLAGGKSRDERRRSGEIYINMPGDPPSMDPTRQSDSNSSMWLGHIYEGLMTRDRSGRNYVPGSAESMTVSPDGKAYTFKIRKNARWHDGKPVTARDFEFAFRRLVDPKFASEYSFMAVTARILNAEDVIKGRKQVSALGVKAVDDRTLVINLTEPVPFFPSLMAFSVFYPVRKDLVEKYGDRFATDAETMVGNGPFAIKRWIHEASMRIEKAETYWNSREISLRAIEAPIALKDNGAEYNQFVTGFLDSVNLDRERLSLAQREKRPIRNYDNGAMVYFEVNQRPGKLFANSKLRQALRLALNRTEFANRIRAIPGTKPAFGIVPDYLPGSKPGLSFRKESRLDWKDYDVEGARRSIREYLQETGQPKVPAFSILGSDSAWLRSQMEYLQNHLKKIFETEIKLDLVPPKMRIQQMRDGKFDIVWSGWTPDYMDCMTFMDLFLSTNENNQGRFKDAKYDSMIKSAQTEPNQAKRIRILVEAENYLLIEKAAVVPLYQSAVAYLAADGLEGYVRMPGMDQDFRYARWK